MSRIKSILLASSLALTALPSKTSFANGDSCSTVAKALMGELAGQGLILAQAGRSGEGSEAAVFVNPKTRDVQIHVFATGQMAAQVQAKNADAEVLGTCVDDKDQTNRIHLLVKSHLAPQQ